MSCPKIFIDLKHANRRPTDRRQSNQFRSALDKMPVPCVPSWIKELRRFSRERINTREVRSLVSVAEKTRESQIARNRFPTMNYRDDVVNLKC